MKKTLLVAALAFASSFAFAQKPASGDLTAEINLSIITGILPINFTLPKDPDPKLATVPAELRFRYFLSDKGAVRLRLGLGSSTDKSSIYNAAGTELSDKTVTSGFGLLFAPGYEMHLEGTDKLSPYFGAELGIMMAGSTTTKVTNAPVKSPTSGTMVLGASYDEKTGSTTAIKLSVFMGADYYFTESLYLGGEFGLGLFSSVSTAEGSETVKLSASATAATTKTPKSSSSALFGTSISGLRFGIKF